VLITIGVESSLIVGLILSVVCMHVQREGGDPAMAKLAPLLKSEPSGFMYGLRCMVRAQPRLSPERSRDTGGRTSVV
jgi:hypothetical protein